MPKYQIRASKRYVDTYIITAKDEDEAMELVYDEDGDHVSTDCVGSDILECELIEEE